MRRIMFLLSLVAAFAGTPLRLVEAADDLARILTDSWMDSEIETIDGGVGDDSGVSTRPDQADAPAATDLGDAAPVPFVMAASSPGLVSRHFVATPRPTPICSGRQRALLQCFLC